MKKTLPRWKRVVSLVIVGALETAQWGLATAMLLTGAVMGHERRALLAGGIAMDADIESCKWEPMHRGNSVGGSSSGYFSCHYTYRAPGADAVARGYFQSPREWRGGQTIRIRYRSDAPGVSATETDLAHPWIVPTALMLLPLAYAVFRYYRRHRS